MVSKLPMNLILGFVGKTHAPKMWRVFDLTGFGADSCQAPLVIPLGNTPPW